MVNKPYTREQIDDAYRRIIVMSLTGNAALYFFPSVFGGFVCLMLGIVFSMSIVGLTHMEKQLNR